MNASTHCSRAESYIEDALAAASTDTSEATFYLLLSIAHGVLANARAAQRS